LAVKSLGKRPLERLRRKCEDNIKIHLREVDCQNEMWMELAQDRVQWQTLVLAVLNLHC